MNLKFEFSELEGELSFIPGFLRGANRSLRLPGGCGLQRSEEVLEALNWEKREMRGRFSWLLSPPRPLLPSSLPRMGEPHLLTVIQILVPKGARPGPALACRLPAVSYWDMELQPATKASSGSKETQAPWTFWREGWGLPFSAGFLAFRSAQETPRLPSWELLCLLRSFVILSIFQNDPFAVFPINCHIFSMAETWNLFLRLCRWLET